MGIGKWRNKYRFACMSSHSIISIEQINGTIFLLFLEITIALKPKILGLQRKKIRPYT